jgi:hypothetical protein
MEAKGYSVSEVPSLRYAPTSPFLLTRQPCAAADEKTRSGCRAAQATATAGVLRDSEHRHTFDAGRIEDRAEVGHEVLKRERGRVRADGPLPPASYRNGSRFRFMRSRQCVHRALPIEFEVAQPMGGP